MPVNELKRNEMLASEERSTKIMKGNQYVWHEKLTWSEDWWRVFWSKDMLPTQMRMIMRMND